MAPKKTCNFKHGEKSCSRECPKLGNGKFQAKCSYHANAAFRRSKKALAKIKALASKDPLADKASMTEGSRLRMRKYREERKLKFFANDNANVQRIATLIDKIKSQQEYIIVPNVVGSSLIASEIKLKGRSEPINFHQDKNSKTRMMQAVKNPEEILPDVLTALKIVFSKCVHVVVKLITSVAGDPQQALHRDFDKEDRPVSTLSEFHYSAIISLEENTRLIVGSLRESINIPLHSMLLFRGDMIHAGAAYTVKNRRLFISASCAKFPVTKYVYIPN